jgi:hypothetical protein
MAMTEKNGPEFPEQIALKGLRKEIRKHFCPWDSRRRKFLWTRNGPA